MVDAGVPGDAEAAGHSAAAGAGEGATDASGAAETHHSDESTDARLLSALRPGTTSVHCALSIFNVLLVCWELEHSYICSWVIVDAVSAS